MIKYYCSYDCAHYTKDDTCMAFPDGIPEDIWSGFGIHDTVLSGQVGDYVYMTMKEYIKRSEDEIHESMDHSIEDYSEKYPGEEIAALKYGLGIEETYNIIQKAINEKKRVVISYKKGVCDGLNYRLVKR